MIHGEIDRDIRKRADYNRQTERMGDSYRRAALDREILLTELDSLRKRAASMRFDVKRDQSDDAQNFNFLDELLELLLGPDLNTETAARPPAHHQV